MRIINFLKITLLLVFVLLIAFFGYFFTGKSEPAENISWGINFSQDHSEKLGFSWQDVYFSLIDDLGAKKIRIAVNWDLVEIKENEYNFKDLDQQVQIADDKDIELILAIGMKTPRWPECHIPVWVQGFDENQRKERVLNLIKEIVLRYKDRDSIVGWQVENEPFFPFGQCPKNDKNLLKEEISLVKSLDDKERPVIISDTGELSLWIEPAMLGDIVGITMYKIVWSPELSSYLSFPYPSVFYWRKAQLIKKVFNKEVICVELQAEPWVPNLIYYSSLDEQEKSMNLTQFKKNIEFAKNTGLKEFYLWGAEWWYFMKEKNNKPEIWEEAKLLFN
ncbi:MAG: cellulase family glycosylhydrolase [Candidatus Pacebacteria bacterium]|nr:cellulase family glycosylhydrolase [Candidatus Paceibacterota bacterium]